MFCTIPVKGYDPIFLSFAQNTKKIFSKRVASGTFLWYYNKVFWLFLPLVAKRLDFCVLLSKPKAFYRAFILRWMFTVLWCLA